VGALKMISIYTSIVIKKHITNYYPNAGEKGGRFEDP